MELGEVLALVAGVTTIALLIASVIRGFVVTSRFEGIMLNMGYEEVVSKIGKPNSSNKVWSEGIDTCVWQRRFLRNWRLSYIIIFKDDRVITITKL